MFTCSCRLFNNRKSAQHKKKSREWNIFILTGMCMYILTSFIFLKPVRLFFLRKSTSNVWLTTLLAFLMFRLKISFVFHSITWTIYQTHALAACVFIIMIYDARDNVFIFYKKKTTKVVSYHCVSLYNENIFNAYTHSPVI